MKALALNLPTFGFVVATRAMLGVGIGLLLSGRLSAERRRVAGLTLGAMWGGDHDPCHCGGASREESSDAR